MKLIRPVAVSDANLTSNIAEPSAGESAYSALASYALGDRVYSPDTHHSFESLAAGNIGHPLTDPAYWLDLGATNRFAMFDATVGTKTTGASGIDVTIQLAATERADGLALFNVSAETVQVIMTDTSGEIYNQTISLLSDSGISSWYEWFSEEIVYKTTLVLTDLPLTSGVSVRVILSSASGAVSCGMLVVGQTRDIGGTQYGAKGGIQDYSRKTTDEFGNTSLVARAYAKRATFPIMADNAQIDSIFDLLAEFRATPVVYVGSEAYGFTALFGWARDWGITISYPTKSLISLEVEGLT